MSIQHSRSKLASLAGIALSATLVLSACGDDDSTTQNGTDSAQAPDVDISYEISDETEEVTIDGDLELNEPTAWLISEGDGDPIENGDLLHILSADIDMENEEITSHDFDLGGQTIQLTEQFEASNPQAFNTLVGAQAGADMALYLPPDSIGQGTPAYLNIISIEDRLPTYATGEPTDESDRHANLPAVTVEEETHAPSIETPQGDAPEELVVDVLKQGDGPEVQAGSYVTIHYRGLSWSNGEEFDSSWGPDNTGAPRAFELQSLITGWQDGLEGQQVGSQVIMSIPPELAYGGQEGHELQDETLVFVIDILHSADPIPAE